MPESPEPNLRALIEESDALWEGGDEEGALAKALEAHAIARQRGDEISDDLLIDVLSCLAGLLLEFGDDRGTLALCDELAALGVEDDGIWLWRGMARLNLCHIDEAQQCLERCDPESEWGPDALWHRAVLAELRGKPAEAERLYTAAHDLAPEEVSMPVRMGADEVQGLLSEVIEALPAPLRDALDSVVIQVEPVPSIETLTSSDPPLSPLILGLYLGTPWGDKSVFDQPADVDRIVIYQRSLERIADDRESLCHELRITLQHEIGHHLGWDEEDLAERGLE